MANKAEKWKDNAGGKFYVDQQCIDCDLAVRRRRHSSKRQKKVATPFPHQPATEEGHPAVAWKPSKAARLRPSGNDGEE